MISTTCEACDGDGRVMCRHCNGGGTDDHPCLACNNRGDERCDTCNGTGEVDPLGPLYRHPQAWRYRFTLTDGVLHLGYVRNGELLTAKFQSIEWAEAFLDKLNSPEAMEAPRGGKQWRAA